MAKIVTVRENLNSLLDRLKKTETEQLLEEATDYCLRELIGRTPLGVRYAWGYGTSYQEPFGTIASSWKKFRRGRYSIVITPNTPYTRRVVYYLNYGTQGSGGAKVPTKSGKPWAFYWHRVGRWFILAKRVIPPIRGMHFIEEAITQTLYAFPRIKQEFFKRVEIKPGPLEPY